MKPLSLLPATLLALSAALPGQAGADDHVSIHCKTTRAGQCAAPPPPPAPPSIAAPPVPPAPPAPLGAPVPPAQAAAMAPPAPPAPPPPPRLPAVPSAAHAACASKAPGSALTWTLRKNETMRGACERQDGQMRFVMQRYDLDD